MAKYDVTHACGHSETVQLVGKHTERERKLEWMAGQDCPECRKAAFNAANAAKAEELRAAGTAAAWPKLTGTDKQIAWAETVRARLLVAAESLLIEAEAEAERRNPGAERPARLDEFGMALDWLRGRTEARYWIDHRDHDARSLLRDAVDEFARDEQRQADARKAEEAARKLWEEKDAIARKAREALGAAADGRPFHVTVWTGGDGERRVFLDYLDGRRLGERIAVYYHTGNHRRRPGSVDVVAPKARDRAEEIKGFAAALAAAWVSIKVDVEVVPQAGGADA